MLYSTLHLWWFLIMYKLKKIKDPKAKKNIEDLLKDQLSLVTVSFYDNVIYEKTLRINWNVSDFSVDSKTLSTTDIRNIGRQLIKRHIAAL